MELLEQLFKFVHPTLTLIDDVGITEVVPV